MLEHQAPLESILQARGGHLIDEPGLRATFLCQGYLLLQSMSVSNLQEAISSEIELELPAPQSSSARGQYALLWLTPAEWLLNLPAAETESMQTALTRRLATSLATVTDMSDAFACCELSDTRAPDVLMGGCSLEVHAHAFPGGRVSRTALADVPAIVWNPGDPNRYRCIVDRSFGVHFLNWLVDATHCRKSLSHT